MSELTLPTSTDAKPEQTVPEPTKPALGKKLVAGLVTAAIAIPGAATANALKSPGGTPDRSGPEAAQKAADLIRTTGGTPALESTSVNPIQETGGAPVVLPTPKTSEEDQAPSSNDETGAESDEGLTPGAGGAAPKESIEDGSTQYGLAGSVPVNVNGGTVSGAVASAPESPVVNSGGTPAQPTAPSNPVGGGTEAP